MSRVEVDAPASELPGLEGETQRSSLGQQIGVAPRNLSFQDIPVTLEANEALALQRDVEL